MDSVPGPAFKHSSHSEFPDMQDPTHGPLSKTGIVDLHTDPSPQSIAELHPIVPKGSSVEVKK